MAVEVRSDAQKFEVIRVPRADVTAMLRHRVFRCDYVDRSSTDLRADAGSAGAMTGFAFPEILVGIVSRWHAGDKDGAADLFYRTVPLMRLEFQEGIGMAVRKEVLKRRGLIADASTRAPGATIDPGTRAALDRLITWTAAQEGLAWISG